MLGPRSVLRYPMIAVSMWGTLPYTSATGVHILIAYHPKRNALG